MLLLQRGHSAAFGDDIAAISNDAPAASVDAELSLAPAFESLGLVAPADNRPSVHDAFSPRSPRGPPAAA